MKQSVEMDKIIQQMLEVKTQLHYVYIADDGNS